MMTSFTEHMAKRYVVLDSLATSVSLTHLDGEEPYFVQSLDGKQVGIIVDYYALQILHGILAFIESLKLSRSVSTLSVASIKWHQMPRIKAPSHHLQRAFLD